MDFNIDLNKLIAEKAKEIAIEHVKSVVETEIRDYEDGMSEYIKDLVERKVDNAIMVNDFNLEEAVTNGIGKAIMPWIEQNLYRGDIIRCIRGAILTKIKDFSLEDLIKMANSLQINNAKESDCERH